VAVDLEAQTATGPDGGVDRFKVDPFRKECLLAGTDKISFTLGHGEQIAAFENAYEAKVRWL
jgi:3-isopropylmalate/(R)-2-methylmalate dehydratase small subunit